MQKAHRERWKGDRDKAVSKGIAKSQQKSAEATANNAVIAARIKAKLLRKLEKEIDALPDNLGSEMYTDVLNYEYNAKGGKVSKRQSGGKRYKLRDLTAAYADLTKDMVFEQERSNGLLQSLLELERRGESHDL